jgi:uncharacterized protein with von Willebrand factor type A (vWA) domain
MHKQFTMKHLFLIITLILLVILAGSVLSREYTTMQQIIFTTDGQPLAGEIDEVDISADGRYVIFVAWGSNIPSNSNANLLVHDRVTNSLR